MSSFQTNLLGRTVRATDGREGTVIAVDQWVRESALPKGGLERLLGVRAWAELVDGSVVCVEFPTDKWRLLPCASPAPATSESAG